MTDTAKFNFSRRFSAPGDFAAWYHACQWLRMNCYTVGDPHRNGKAAIKHTDSYRTPVPAWPQLTAQELAELDGMLVGDPRTGPLTVYLKRDPEQLPDIRQCAPEEMTIYRPAQQQEQQP